MSKPILLVDDDPIITKLVSGLVEQEGYHVLTAKNGREALEVMHQHCPPLVITDWQMPEMDGLELCRALKAAEQFGFVYAIILTSTAGEDELVEAFDAGADDFIVKPVNRRELLARVRAGQRVVDLQQELTRRTLEVFRSSAKMEIANRKLEEANRELNRLATTDALTGLGNRRAAIADLEHQWSIATRHWTPLTCVSLDIDHFKSVNDTHGHAAGDRVLSHVGRCLRGICRESDRAYRIGGEEFIIICPHTAVQAGAVAAERVRASVQRMVIDDHAPALRVTVSLGVAQRTTAMLDIDDLLKAADDALYTAKRGGRDQVVRADTGQPAHREAG